MDASFRYDRREKLSIQESDEGITLFTTESIFGYVCDEHSSRDYCGEPARLITFLCVTTMTAISSEAFLTAVVVAQVSCKAVRLTVILTCIFGFNGRLYYYV